MVAADLLSLDFLVPYTLAIFLWGFAGYQVCHLTHKQRGIETEAVQVVDLDPSPKVSA